MGEKWVLDEFGIRSQPGARFLKSEVQSVAGEWEAPSGRRKSWRRKNPHGEGYIYRDTPPGQSEGHSEEQEPIAAPAQPTDEGGPLKPGGGPGIFGMSQAEVEVKIADASERGRKQPDLNKTGAKQAWIDLWDDLFPTGTEAEMARLPDGNVDPATVVVTWDRLKSPHEKAFLRYTPPGKNKSQTCNTVENLASNDVKHWAHVKGLMGEGSPDQMLNALKGRGERPSDEALGKIHDLATGLKGDWQDEAKSTRERDSAAINTIIMMTGKRRGQLDNYRRTGNRGITTLHAGDVTIDGDQIKFDFIGKNGARNTASIQDEALASYLGSRKEGKEEGERLFDASDTSVDKALADNNSPTPKPKDWRTLVSTARAQQVYGDAGSPKVKVKVKEYKPGTYTHRTQEEVPGKKPGTTKTVTKTEKMTFEEAHKAGHIGEDKAKKSVSKEMSVKDALDAGHIDKETALKVTARQILEVAKTVQKEMNHSSAGMTRDNYIHPQVFDDYLGRHGISDLKPPALDPYAKHSRSKSLSKGFGDQTAEQIKPFQGTKFYARAIRALARIRRAEADLADYHALTDDSPSNGSWSPIGIHGPTKEDLKWKGLYSEKQKAEAAFQRLEAEFLEWAAGRVDLNEDTKKGFTLIVKGEPGGFDGEGNPVEDPNRNGEEDTFHWPPWLLKYGLTPEEIKRLKTGTELHYRDEVSKGFTVMANGIRLGFVDLF
jgi:hypothetical protein